MATTISQIYRPVWHGRLVKRHRRHGAEALTSRTVRSPRHHSLPAAGLERGHCFRLPRICHSQLWFFAIGGVLYSLGTLFHVWQRLRFQNAIWHGFVLLAASCHYSRSSLACLAQSEKLQCAGPHM